jgi:hypothetical protein
MTYPLANTDDYPVDPAECAHNWLQPANQDANKGPTAKKNAVSVCGSCGTQFDAKGKQL